MTRWDLLLVTDEPGTVIICCGRSFTARCESLLLDDEALLGVPEDDGMVSLVVNVTAAPLGP